MQDSPIRVITIAVPKESAPKDPDQPPDAMTATPSSPPPPAPSSPPSQHLLGIEETSVAEAMSAMKRKADDVLGLIATSYKRQRCELDDLAKLRISIDATESAMCDVKNERDSAVTQLQVANSDCAIMNKKNSEQEAEIDVLSVDVKKLKAMNSVLTDEKYSVNEAMNEYKSQVLTLKRSIIANFKSFDMLGDNPQSDARDANVP